MNKYNNRLAIYQTRSLGFGILATLATKDYYLEDATIPVLVFILTIGYSCLMETNSNLDVGIDDHGR